ncbi:hypothetical protein F4556_005958 [Kitasatospora gansuensis]|uniref:NB-ARC domain-containing protein n=1 Tax=Kitasatospora gansuensis TaxID=258050 RepID=A0A7W7SIC0_9ACTN|nr:ATP-binding protein [Kitasatospora gansuensis]MBB4950423.1 hypothetical protein [Kitasatospora gansuensis]
MTENSISGGQFESVVMAGTVHLHSGAVQQHFARMLAQPVRRFVNRTAVLDSLDGWHREDSEADRPTVVVLSGVGGIGKTETALHWIRRQVAAFPGHQLYADLSPQGPSAPRQPAAVLEQLLSELGVAKDDRPSGTEELAARFRSLTGAGPVVLLLDNAVSAAQVRPLLPGSAQAVVVVTSRTRLPGLMMSHDAHLVDLDPLTVEESRELLGGAAGDAADVVLRACGGLPLAVRIAAARIADALPGELAELMVQLTDGERPLDALTMPDDISVRDVFAASYRWLSPAAARYYRQLGVHPGGVFRVEAAEPVAELVNSSLATPLGDGRYRMHDLVRQYAAECATLPEHAEERAAAVGEVLRRGLLLAAGVDSALSGRWRYEPEPLGVLPAFADADAAVRELAGQREAVFGAVRLAHLEGRHVVGWQLGQALWGFCLRTGAHRDWIDSHRLGLDCAVRSGDRLAVARMHFQLGFAHLDRALTDPDHDDFGRAGEQFGSALTVARELAHARTESSALEGLGLLALKRAQWAEAGERFTEARAALAGIDHPRGLALLTSHLGRARLGAGAYGVAADCFLTAREMFAALPRPDVYNQARSLTHLAECRRLERELPAAVAALAEAAELMKGEGSDRELGGIHLRQGDLLAELGDRAAARVQWQAAVRCFEGSSDPRGGEARGRLG